MINFLFCLDLKKNNVTILVIKTVCAGRPVRDQGVKVPDH
uniref:Uncharacterized protein n=1 Tax=Klebsiella pneumoniae TaxID=573 RepID=A0A6G9HVU0_KLEPN|nr:hypothetical protein [Klebsiella pneumoniae]UNB12597.1 hypothetical protein [Escherichia coli]QIQ14810.1 hypothetical protein [Klebsiella pneumoniae]QIQ15271.1 hypothetical protein [Klebsiella pneumoniae]QIQ16195.1 hypothetical protein [Klebsiella pneumoniae]